MNTILEQINSTGKAFVEFAVPMLVQSSVLIVILLLIDLALRKKVKAVFRYCIWMLILVKLILPTSLSSPLSLGYWFGDKLAYVAESRTAAAPEAEALEPALADMLHIIEPVPIEADRPTPAVLPMMPDVEPAVTEAVSPPAVSVTPVSWQGIVFLLWLAVVMALGLLLLQRAMFVRGLVAQAKEANALMNGALKYCRKCMGVKRKIGLKVSANAASPAVCGLFRPVILLPHKLAPSLGSSHLRAVLLHELAHIKRGDLWVNLVQTVLQIIYFYNPLLWLANAMIRRVREQAIDETVLVAMGEKAQQYPQTLVNVAKLAFKRPALSLRLIGVVESKSALAGRIKHILNRPMPKSAKVGVVGVLAVIIAAAVLLPMAKTKENQKLLKGIDEKLKVTDKAGELTINSLYMPSPNGKSLVGTNKVTLYVDVTNNSKKDIYLGLEYYTDSGYIAEVFSPGATSLAQIKKVPANWQGKLEYPIYYNRFVKGGYVKITLARCAGKQIMKEKRLAFLPPEVEVIYEKKHNIVSIDDTEPDAGALTDSSFAATLPNGVTVELVGVCEHPSEGKQWWRPDGTMLSEAPYEKTNSYADPKDDNDFEIAFRFGGYLLDDINLAWKRIPGAINGTVAYGSALVDDKRVPDFVTITASFPKNQNTVTIPLGVAAGSWKSFAITDGRGERSTSAGDKVVRFEAAYQKEAKTYLMVWHNFHDAVARLIAIDTSGKPQIGNEVEGGIGKGVEGYKYAFEVPLKEITTFHLQTRPYQWVTFKNVSLRPGHKTAVQVEGEGKNNEVKALEEIGVRLRKHGRVDEAIGYFKKAIDTSDSAEVALQQMGEIYSERGDYERSLKYFEMFLKIRPKNEVITAKANRLKKDLKYAESVPWGKANNGLQIRLIIPKDKGEEIPIINRERFAVRLEVRNVSDKPIKLAEQNTTGGRMNIMYDWLIGLTIGVRQPRRGAREFFRADDQDGYWSRILSMPSSINIKPGKKAVFKIQLRRLVDYEGTNLLSLRGRCDLRPVLWERDDKFGLWNGHAVGNYIPLIIKPSSEKNDSPDVQVEGEDEQTGTLSSRAWYILRQWNVGPLLLGLTQRLGKVIDSSQRDDRVWTGVDDGGRLELDIEVEGEISGEIYVGFFEDASWSGEPVQVRSFPKAGQYTVKNLPPGKFQIGAMIGMPPVAAALGVHRMWPKPVEVERGKTTVAQVLVSRDFQKCASGWYNREVSKDFIGDWNDINSDNLLQGRLTGPAGRPIPFAEIMIREHNPGSRRGIAAPNRGTNEQGYYKYDGMKWPYVVSAKWRQSMPSVLGYRYQHQKLGRVLEESQTVNFQFEPFPVGSASLNGRVTDQHGNPIREFFLWTWNDLGDEWRTLDGRYHNMVGYHVPFVSKDGRFKLDALPMGEYRVMAIPFNIQAYERDWDPRAVLEVGQTTVLNLEVVAKNIFYGRVLFEDGSPAVIKPAPWPEAKTSIIMPMGRGQRARAVATVGEDGYFTVHLNQREIEQLRSGESRLIINVPTAEKGRRKSMGEFPFELVAEQRDKAGAVKIKRPQTDVPVDVEVETALGWLKLIDDGDYAKSWDEMATLFRGAVRKADWEKTMDLYGKGFGKVVSRKVESKRHTRYLPTGPAGEYVIIEFESSFENKRRAAETVTLMRDRDGVWRVTSYNIK